MTEAQKLALKIRSRNSYLRNRDRVLAKTRARYEAKKELITAQRTAYAKAHPEVQKKAQRQYRERNREACLKRSRDHYHGDLEGQRERGRIKGKKAFADNPEKILAKNRAWAARNKDKIRARDLRRRARKQGAELGDPKLIATWMARVKAMKFVRCHWCGTKVPGRKVHFDHVLALNLHGAHSIDNLCASCQECNCSKRDKSLTDWLARGQTFLKL